LLLAIAFAAPDEVSPSERLKALQMLEAFRRRQPRRPL